MGAYTIVGWYGYRLACGFVGSIHDQKRGKKMKLIKELIAIILIFCVTLLVSCGNKKEEEQKQEERTQVDAYVKMLDGEIVKFENVICPNVWSSEWPCYQFTTQTGERYRVSWNNLMLIVHEVEEDAKTN